MTRIESMRKGWAGGRQWGVRLALLLSAWIAGMAMAAPKAQAAAATAQVVCYAALDEDFSRPLLEEFERRTGYTVSMVFDSESTKSVGLTNRLLAEAGRPRCDVFWNNEILNTLRLKERGVLAEYVPDAAAGFPDEQRDPDGRWTGFAARARVLIVNTELLPREFWPRSLSDFLDLAERCPATVGMVGMGKPLFGTTATWMASLYSSQVAGDRDGLSLASRFVAALKDDLRVRILTGNKQVAVSVARGDLLLGFTDTDDALIEMAAGRPVEMVFLSEGGSMLIPNTLSLIKGSPNPQGGKALIEFLLSPYCETVLANSASGQIPVNPLLVPARDYPERFRLPEGAGLLRVQWSDVSRSWDEAMGWANSLFVD